MRDKLMGAAGLKPMVGDKVKAIPDRAALLAPAQ
jgi:hypothetical protein